MAALTNGDFESGDLSGWTTSGEVSIEGTTFGSGPTQGSYQALLKSGPDKSEMWQSFTANDGDILSFDWNFLTNEGTPQWEGYNDKAWVELHWADAGRDPHILADTWSTFDSSETEFDKETGFKTFSVEIPSNSEYIIKFGVQTTGDASYTSALLIDKVAIKGAEDCMPTLANGDFEAGNLRCWEALGDVSIKDATFGSGPTQGSYQALLKSGTDQSEMWQSFTANDGEIFSFDWNFLTNEGTPQWEGYNDKAWVELHWEDAGGDPHILADTWSAFDSSATEFDKETGFSTFSAVIPNTSTYIVKFGVKTTGDNLYSSALLIDNVKLQAP